MRKNFAALRLAHVWLICVGLTAGSFPIRAGVYPVGALAQTFSYQPGTVDLGDGSTIGFDDASGLATNVVAIVGGALRLVDATTTNLIGSFKLPELDPANVVKSFDLKLSVIMNAPLGGDAGEGWSVNFGKIPQDNGTGEGGFAPLPRGLTVTFSVRGTDENPSSIGVLVGGVAVGDFPRSFLLDGTSRAFSMHWDAFGLDLSFDGKVVCSDLPTPGFSPGVGDAFAFSARTTTATLGVSLDNLTATTQALPVLDTGGPIISEFVANNSEFEDEFAEKPGWIEIFNGSPESIDFTGWYLTDSKKNLTKWRISGLNLTPYSYQIAFASGRNRQIATNRFLHTSFSLAKSGGYVALVRPDGSVASSYEYGPQDKNVSYGEASVSRTKGYMFPSSPGLVNSAVPAPASRSAEVQFSHPGGFIGQTVELSLTVPTAAGIEIRYTTNRTEPGRDSLLYSSPLTIAQLTTIRARSFLPDHLPGPVSSCTFIVLDQTLTNYGAAGKIFESSLPIIYLDSFGVGVDGSSGGTRAFRPSYSVVIAPDKVTGRATLTNAPDYAGPAGVHVRGESSAGFGQLSYAFETWDESSQDMDVSLLGMPADSDWVLYGPWSEKTLMRNALIFDWMRTLRGEDGTAVRTRWVELFFNQSKSPTSQGVFGAYRGIYVLMEKLKRGKDRVPLENLNQKTVDPELITGGYIIRKDKPDSLKNNWTTSKYSVDLQSFDPDRLNTSQLTYIKSYISAFETALGGANFKDFNSGYRAYIDPDTFIDAQWMLEVSKQVDGYVFSTYWHKDRAGRLRAGPLWDFNIALGNADYGTGDTPTGWLYGNANGAGQIWYPRLHADPDYKLAHWDRYWEMRRGILSTEAIMAKIQANMSLLLDGYAGLVSNRAPASVENPVARHFRRWPRLGQRDWPNPPAETSIRTWQAEVGYMTNWLNTRLAWIDDQTMRSNRFAWRPPVLSDPGGDTSVPIQLVIEPYRRTDNNTTFAEGEIYYTLDKSDPRLAGGAIHPDAQRYVAPVTIASSVTINARLYAQKLWSPLATATFRFHAQPARASNLVVSELMILPAPLSTSETNAGLVTAQGFEYIELRNIATAPIDLAGVRFTRGVTFSFDFASEAGRLLLPGQSMVLVADRRAFNIRYPHVAESRIGGQFQGHLDNSGETLELLAADDSLIKRFSFDTASPWPFSGGSGQSIILLDPASNPDPSNPAQWVLSAKSGGTPGESGLGSNLFFGDAGRDRDGDGLSDLFEFATGSDPEDPSSAFPPTVRFVPGGAGLIEFSHRSRPDAQGIKVAIEASGDLQSWSENLAGLALDRSSTNRDGTVTLTYTGPAQGRRSAFYRLKVQPR